MPLSVRDLMHLTVVGVVVMGFCLVAIFGGFWLIDFAIGNEPVDEFNRGYRTGFAVGWSLLAGGVIARNEYRALRG